LRQNLPHEDRQHSHHHCCTAAKLKPLKDGRPALLSSSVQMNESAPANQDEIERKEAKEPTKPT